jgi:hypothetical protein
MAIGDDMRLKPFAVTLTYFVGNMGTSSTIDVWTATAKAARECGESYAREEGIPDATITVTPHREYS